MAGVFALRIKAVVFDLGNTLVKYDVGSPEEVFHRVLTSLGIRRSIGEIKEALLKAEKEAEELSYQSLYGKIPCEEYWFKWNSLVLKHLNIAGNEKICRDVPCKMV